MDDRDICLCAIRKSGLPMDFLEVELIFEGKWNVVYDLSEARNDLRKLCMLLGPWTLDTD
jgi:cell fate regulator YaaT (PSP1 superfamily)